METGCSRYFVWFVFDSASLVQCLYNILRVIIILIFLYLKLLSYFLFFFDSQNLPYKFLTRLRGVRSGGGRGFPPEALKEADA